MRATKNHQAAVEDTDRRRVPALLKKVNGGRVLKEDAVGSGWRRARFQDADSLVSRRSGDVAVDLARSPTDANLESCGISEIWEHRTALWLTMVPLLNKAPLAQKESVSTLRGRTELVSRSHSAPQAEKLPILRG